MTDAREVIEALDMRRHPEGGWWVETWRAPAVDGVRPSSSAILYLLEASDRSHWHRVDAAEVWQYSAGDPLELRVAAARATAVAVARDAAMPATRDAAVAVHRLGPAVTAGETVQVVVPAGAWQAARPLGAWTLVGCIVAPAFEFAGFELAPEGWEPAP
ncbi:MAG: cupin domain-containing protein [Chloroflexota bacterium]